MKRVLLSLPFVCAVFLSAIVVKAESVPNPDVVEIHQKLMKYDVLLDEDGDYQEQLDLASKIDSETPAIFYQCNGPDTCVITGGACGENRVVSIHAKNYFDAAMSIYGAVIDCEAIPNHYTDIPKCIEQKCVLIHEMPKE